MLKAEFKEVSGYSPNSVFTFFFDIEFIPLVYKFILNMHDSDSLSQLCIYYKNVVFSTVDLAVLQTENITLCSILS